MDQQTGACTAATRDAGAPSHALSRPVRWLFVALGVISVGFAVVGAIVPGLPTTVFLIVASYCFARSCPWLEERLLGHRLFAPYLPYVRQGAPMPRRARVIAIAAMWVSISISLVAVERAGWLSPASGAGMVGAGAVGTMVILLVRRGPSPAGSALPAVGASSPEGGPVR
jgi:hypothetical protein